jgi:cardiolipin synthase
VIGEAEKSLCLLPDSFRAADRVELLSDGGQAFPAMLEAIARAEQHIFLEMYIFADDSTGQRFARALGERARAGVAVWVVYDADGSRDTPRKFFDEMRSQGIQVFEFNPIHRFFYGLRLRSRNHGKLLLVDGRVGFVGGLNFAREYASLDDGGLGWRDTELRLEGPVVSDLIHVAQAVVRYATRRLQEFPIVPSSAIPDKEGTQALVLSAIGFRNRWKMGRHYFHALRRSRQRVWIANPYFLPNAFFRRELLLAVRRGVDVRLLVPSQTDFRPVAYASQHLFERFFKWGIRVFHWTGPMMHAKTGVIDGRWSTVGSYNFDRFSLLNNYELSVIVLGREFGERMESMFEGDFAKSIEIQPDGWKRRGVRRKLIERLSYSFRMFY